MTLWTLTNKTKSFGRIYEINFITKNRYIMSDDKFFNELQKKWEKEAKEYIKQKNKRDDKEMLWFIWIIIASLFTLVAISTEIKDAIAAIFDNLFK